ncbi:MAG: hypothetical protein ABR985_20380 [Methanotrichaceae archaeon]
MLDSPKASRIIIFFSYLDSFQALLIQKLGSEAGLYLDLLGRFSAGKDPVAFEILEDAIEAALFDSAPVFQARVIKLEFYIRTKVPK